MGDYRLLSYALDAYGLGDQVHNTALVTKVLEAGVSNPKSLANTLSRFRTGEPSPPRMIRRQGRVLRVLGERGQDDERRLRGTAARERSGRAECRRSARALLPARSANISSAYGILADPNLLEVAQTIFGLPPRPARPTSMRRRRRCRT